MPKNLKFIEPTRLYTAFFILVAILLIIFFHHPLLLWAVLGIAFIIGFYESYKLYNKNNSKPPIPVLCAYNMVKCLSFGISAWCFLHFGAFGSIPKLY